MFVNYSHPRMLCKSRKILLCLILLAPYHPNWYLPIDVQIDFFKLSHSVFGFLCLSSNSITHFATTNEISCFLWKNYIPLCICHLIHLNLLHDLSIMKMLLWTWCNRFIFDTLISCLFEYILYQNWQIIWQLCLFF